VPFATHLDGRIEYFVRGSGPPLMLVGGVGDTADLWEDHGYVDALSPHFTTIAVNPRGYGGSSPITELEHLPYALYRDDLHAVIDDFGAEQVAVMGYSRGGILSTALATEYPGRVSALVVGGANLGRSLTYREDAVAQAARTGGRPWYHPRRVAGRIRRRLQPGRYASASRWRPVLEQHGIPMHEAWDRYIRPVADIDRAVERLSMPVLFFQGDQDLTFDLGETRALVERLQDGHLEVIANANHEVIHEPERVLSVVTPFLLQSAGLG